MITPATQELVLPYSSSHELTTAVGREPFNNRLITPVDRARILDRWTASPREILELPPEELEFFHRRSFRQLHPSCPPGSGPQPKPIHVPGMGEGVVVKIASTRQEWEGAFALVADNYKLKGYEGSLSCKVRFTPYHALPDTMTFIAKWNERVLMTMTLVPDNTLLGLPMETIYAEEVRQLRRQRRRVAEVISLSADKVLEQRDFLPLFRSVIRLAMQYHLARGGDTWVITVNPHHAKFYTKYLGYAPLGPRRIYDEVGGHPAEAFVLDEQIMKSNAPKKHREMLQEWLPGESFLTTRMPPQLLRYLSRKTGESNRRVIQESFDFDDFFCSPRRW